MRLQVIGLALVIASVASGAQAQVTYTPAPPPLPVQPPAPAPAVAPPPPGTWHEGDPVPRGYHVEGKPRDGLVTAGWITTGIPYFFSVIAALSASEQNESGWLFVPFAGPWMTMGRRAYSCTDAPNQSTSQSLGCVADVFVVMGLIADGVAQAAGGTLLFVGYVATKPGLVRNDEAVRVLPMRVGTGMGAGVIGRF